MSETPNTVPTAPPPPPPKKRRIIRAVVWAGVGVLIAAGLALMCARWLPR